MARSLRPHLPGTPFHLTARLQGRVPWLADIQPAVVHWLREYANRSGCDVIAFAVMPNHLHIVVVQGPRPLAELMQPLLRRVAIHIHARHGSEGHAFQRRYHSSPCTDPDYLRNTIAYVHLNPVRAQLCKEPEQYAWTTHPEYCATALSQSCPNRGAVGGLRLFSPQPRATQADIHENYRAFLEWRIKADEFARRQHGRNAEAPLRPTSAGGDIHWVERFGWNCTSRAEGQCPPRPSVDLKDLALRLLQEIEPEMSLDVLRSGDRTRPIVAVRRQFIIRAKERGHRHRTIARFLNVSDVTISRS
jgi:REP element-mobilizing transposase RayT